MARKNKIKVCYILSYRDPKYVRTRVLLGSLGELGNIELHTAINSSRGIVRYVETLTKLIYVRFKHNPDIYLLGFRGQEIFWPVRVLTFRKKLIFDEFIVMYDWFVNEQKKIKNPLLKKILYAYNKSILKNSDLILEDTKTACEFSAGLFSLPLEKYKHMYVGTDETTFKKRADGKKPDRQFNVFFYGTMLPLHGVEYILRAAEKLKSKPVKFTIIGQGYNKKSTTKIINRINKMKLKNLEYKSWVRFEELPEYISAANICLGGPFGDTPQSKRVISGKTFQFLAMAKPTIVTDLPENTGFKDKQNVIICERGKNESLAEAIEWSYKNRSKLNDIGFQGHNLYKNRYSQKVVSKELESVLSRLD